MFRSAPRRPGHPTTPALSMCEESRAAASRRLRLSGKCRDNLVRDGLADQFTPGGVEDPVDSQVDAADLVLLDRVAEGEGSFPLRPGRTGVVRRGSVELVGDESHG